MGDVFNLKFTLSLKLLKGLSAGQPFVSSQCLNLNTNIFYNTQPKNSSLFYKFLQFKILII